MATWCRRCGLRTTAANRAEVWDPVLSAYRAEHDGECPPNPHNPDSAPTWETRATGATCRPNGMAPGGTLSLSWQEQPIAAAEMPDRVVTRAPCAGAATATATVTVVGVHQATFGRDGMSFGADGDVGSIWWAVVRRPTPDELTRATRKGGRR